MAQHGGTYTARAYLALPDAARYELIDGELVEVPPAEPIHDEVADHLHEALAAWIGGGRPGLVARARPVVLSERTVVRPDVVYVAGTLPPGRVTPSRAAGGEGGGGLQGPADLVAEVLAALAPERDRRLKKAVYAASRVQEYWIVDPWSDMLEIWTAGNAGWVLSGTYTRGDIADSPLLAGFSLDLSRLFA